MITSTLGMIQNVLLTMHENRRQQTRSIFYGGVVHVPASEDPLVVKLQHLRRNLRRKVNTQSSNKTTQRGSETSFSNLFDATELVVPFVDIVHAEQSSGTIKNAALSALHHFFITGMLTRHSTRISPAVNATAYAAINCRFEMSDAGSDEVVLHSVLLLVSTLLDSKEVGYMLTDEVVWGISQAAFSLAFTHHRSLLLRKESERAMKSIMYNVFSRLGDMLDGKDNTEKGGVDEVQGDKNKKTTNATNATSGSNTYTPHGLPVAVKLFNFAMQLVDTKHHDDLFADSANISRMKRQLRTRRAQQIGLEMVNMALSNGGKQVCRSPALLSIIQEDVCRSIILLCFNKGGGDHLLRCSLETFQLLMIHCRTYIKSQIGVFFQKVYLSHLTSASNQALQWVTSRQQAMKDGADNSTNISSSISGSISNMSNNSRLHMILESLADLSSHEWLWMELYANFDCDSSSPNILLPLCKCSGSGSNIYICIHWFIF
jgi:golgi-specific brefeldin A-resistance guanine nucleotide exchange factor 1